MMGRSRDAGEGRRAARPTKLGAARRWRGGWSSQRREPCTGRGAEGEAAARRREHAARPREELLEGRAGGASRWCRDGGGSGSARFRRVEAMLATSIRRGVSATLPQCAPGDPPPLRAHPGDAAPGQTLPLCVLHLGDPTGQRCSRDRECPPRRAQPAPFLHLAAAGHLRLEKVLASPSLSPIILCTQKFPAGVK
ncbi:hypothetical protein PVAP13_8KG307100 [Panicum virgatum]|uniref:Uncharacterized protein n=1 Tax=Panicum virgatum TaxID=38727 RepID=A0A8T0PYC0_PANVG|nr:hypothetical protein PVAP13_8KG307100 [Panicum virgatum]